MTGMGGRGKLCSARGVVLGSPARGWGHCTPVGLNQGGSTASAHGAAPHLSPFTSIWGRKTDAIFLQPNCAGAQGQGPAQRAFCSPFQHRGGLLPLPRRPCPSPVPNTPVVPSPGAGPAQCFQQTESNRCQATRGALWAAKQDAVSQRGCAVPGTPSCPNGNKYLPATGANEASCVWLKNLLQDPCQVPLLLVAAEKIAARAKAQCFCSVRRE